MNPSKTDVDTMIEALELLTARGIRMTGKVCAASYNEFRIVGWTDEALIAAGHMESLTPIKPDYKKPLPSYLGKRKTKQ